MSDDESIETIQPKTLNEKRRDNLAKGRKVLEEKRKLRKQQMEETKKPSSPIIKEPTQKEIDTFYLLKKINEDLEVIKSYKKNKRLKRDTELETSPPETPPPVKETSPPPTRETPRETPPPSHFNLLCLANEQKTLGYRESFTAPDSSFILRRNKHKIIPISGSSTYSYEGTNRISFRIPALWLDGNDSYFRFIIKGSDLTGASSVGFGPNGTSASPFQRLRVTLGGVVVSDINNINCIENLITRLSSNDDYSNGPLGRVQGIAPTNTNNADVGTTQTTDFTNGVEMIFKPKSCNFLGNDHYLPLPYLPECVVELTLANPKEVLTCPGGTGTPSYEISDCTYNIDTVEMDAFYTQSFEMSLASKPLNFYFTTFTNFSTTIAGTSD
eukprot:Awhi_evm1s11602